jgi:hypothetical protein
MSNDIIKYFYVYYSYEPWGRGYIGKRECECLPEEDVKYFGSYMDKTFNPTEKIVIDIFNTRKEAYIAEAKLHKFYNVKNNPHFANQTNQYLNRNEMFKIKELRINDKNFKNQFISFVKESKSVRQILFKLGLKEAGGNYNSIKTWITLLNLDTSHFTGMGWNKGKKLGDRITEEQKEKSHYKYTYTVTTPTEEIIITKNLKKYCRDNNLNQRNMWLVSVGRVKTCKGYKVTRKLINNQKINVL